MAFARRGVSNKPIETANLFGALQDEEKKKKKKKEDKKKDDDEPLKSLSPMANSSMNWADCADSDEEDMFGSSPANWGDEVQPSEIPVENEEEPEEEDEEQDEPEEEEDVVQITMSSHSKPAPQQDEKQLSKKELKRLEMEELDRALAEMGLDTSSSSIPAADKGESVEQNPAPAASEDVGSKKSRKRGGKKNNKSAPADAPSADPSDPTPTLNPQLKSAVNDNGSLDPDAVAKLIAAKHGSKKKEAGSGSTSAAAKEAAARKAKGGKSKSKADKKNYNQQPTR